MAILHTARRASGGPGIPPRWTQSVKDAIGAPFRLRWTADEWSVARDTESTATDLGISFADVPVASGQVSPLRFTLFWPEAERWEGRDFAIDVTAP